MADRSDDSTRPAKRARLDDSAPSTLSNEASATAPTAPVPAAIETDLDREVRAGITEYVCPNNLGFTGVLKQRYTDFLVNEIGLDGQVLHLRSTEVEHKKGEKEDESRKATNGARKEEVKPERTAVKEVKEAKEDADMQDAAGAEEAMLPVPVKTEHVPKGPEEGGEQVPGVSQPAVQPEAEEEVGMVNGACASDVLTYNSSRTKTAKHYNPYSASRPRTRS
jgi:tRNA pseudouridine13 synthase